MADGLRYLLDVLHDLTEVVVVSRDGRLLDEPARRSEGEGGPPSADALLELLDELATTAPAKPRREFEHAARHIRGALSGLLAFVPGVERVQREAAVVLGPAGVA